MCVCNCTFITPHCSTTRDALHTGALVPFSDNLFSTDPATQKVRRAHRQLTLLVMIKQTDGVLCLLFDLRVCLLSTLPLPLTPSQATQRATDVAFVGLSFGVLALLTHSSAVMYSQDQLSFSQISAVLGAGECSSVCAGGCADRDGWKITCPVVAFQPLP